MKTLCTIPVQIILGVFLNGTVLAASSGDEPGTSLQDTASRVESLEAELSAAQREVDRLEAELSAARQQLVSQEGKAGGLGAPSTPSAITHLTERHLEDGGIRDITRVAQQVPGLLSSQTGIEARFAVRGAYTNRTGPEAEPILAIFQDGVPVTTTTDALVPYVDVREIDVLRGPQGVAYGRNAFGGVITVHANNPDTAGWQTALEGTIGSSDLTRFQAMLNIPVLPTLAIRLAGSSESYGGYINNYVLEESDADDLKTRIQQYVRLAARWQPSDDFSLQLNFVSLDQNGTGSGMWGYQQTGAMIDGQYYPGHHYAQAGTSADYGPWDIARNMDALAELENLSTSLVLDWDLGFASLYWLVNKSKFESLQAFDSDYSNGGSAYDSDFNGWDSFMDTWFSELRLTSTRQGRFDWFAGLNLQNRETDWAWLETVEGGLRQPWWDSQGLYVSDSMAAYAGAGYKITDRARMFTGLRWYEDEKQTRYGDRDNWSDLLWEAGVEYVFSETMQSYLSASTGYRPGGLNEVSGVPVSFAAETVTAYEIGLKTKFARQTIGLNLAAFLNDYEDVQAQSFTQFRVPGAAGVMDYLSSAGGKEATGLEVEFQWLPDQHWQISAQLAWLDASFEGYTVPGLNGLDDTPGYNPVEGLSLDGWRPAFTPEWMLGVQASYLFNLGRWGQLRPLIQASYSSDYYTNDLNLPGALQPAHSITDLRLFWDLPGDRLKLHLYIENFSDEQVRNSTMIYNPEERPSIATFLADWGDPRKYGMTLSYRY